MSEGKEKRKTYGGEFKAKVGLEAVRGVKTINKIAQEYGVHPMMVGQWKKAILEMPGRCSKASAVQNRKRRTRARIGCTARSVG